MKKLVAGFAALLGLLAAPANSATRYVYTAPTDLYVNIDYGIDVPGCGQALDASACKTLAYLWVGQAALYDCGAQAVTVHLAVPASGKHYAPLITSVGWTGCYGYAGNGGIIITGDVPNSSVVVVDGGSSGPAFSFGAGTSGIGGVLIRNLTVTAPNGDCIDVWGSGTGVAAQDITFGQCSGFAMGVAHGGEGSFKNIGANYTLFMGTAYTALVGVGSGGMFTGGESANWAIGTSMSTTLGTIYAWGNAEVNLGGLNSINPALVTGYKIVCSYNSVVLTGNGAATVPGSGGIQATNGCQTS